MRDVTLVSVNMGTTLSSPPAPIRILLIGAHSLFRSGLRLLLDGRPGFTVIGEAATFREALSANHLQPDIVLLDLDAGEESDFDILPKLLESGGRLLTLTGVRSHSLHRRCVRHGAMGLVLKEDPPEVLIKAIEKVHAGEVWLDRSMIASLLTELLPVGQASKPNAEAAKIATLTKREREVIALLGEGLKNKGLADRLFITEATVRHHLTSIFSKLEVSGRLELMTYAYRHGLTKLSS